MTNKTTTEVIQFTCPPPSYRSIVDHSTNLTFNLSEDNKMAAVQLMALPPDVEVEFVVRIKE